MTTTIRVPDDIKKRLHQLKSHPDQEDHEVIEEALDRMEEDELQLSDEMREQVEESRRQFAEGKFRTLDEVEADLE